MAPDSALCGQCRARDCLPDLESLRHLLARHCQLVEPHAVCQSYGMDTPPATATYKDYRFPVEIISRAVWLYLRFCLSFRDVEELPGTRSSRDV